MGKCNGKCEITLALTQHCLASPQTNSNKGSLNSQGHLISLQTNQDPNALCVCDTEISVCIL